MASEIKDKLYSTNLRLVFYTQHLIGEHVWHAKFFPWPSEQFGNTDVGPLVLNAFDLIIFSRVLDLSALFVGDNFSPNF